MASTLLDTDKDEEQEGRQIGGQMSFLEHLDELRRRIIRSVAFVFVALFLCWFVSDRIYNFLAVPVSRALADAAQRPVPLQGLTGGEQILPLRKVREGDAGRFVFRRDDQGRHEPRPFGRVGGGPRRPRVGRPARRLHG